MRFNIGDTAIILDYEDDDPIPTIVTIQRIAENKPVLYECAPMGYPKGNYGWYEWEVDMERITYEV